MEKIYRKTYKDFNGILLSMTHNPLFKDFYCPRCEKKADYSLMWKILPNGTRVFYKMCRNIWCMTLVLDHIEHSLVEKPKENNK